MTAETLDILAEEPGLHWPQVRGWLQGHGELLTGDRALLEELGLRPHGPNVVDFTPAALTRLEAEVERETDARKRIETVARANFAAQTQTHVAERLQELLGVLGRDQPFAHVVTADKAGNAGQCLDVRTCSGFGTDEQEDERYGLAVEGIEFDRVAHTAGRHAQLAHRRGLAVRDCDTVADPGREHGFPLAYGAQHIVLILPFRPRDDSDQLAQQLFLGARRKRNPDSLARQQFGEEQIDLSAGAGRVTGFVRNALT